MRDTLFGPAAPCRTTVALGERIEAALAVLEDGGGTSPIQQNKVARLLLTEALRESGLRDTHRAIAPSARPMLVFPKGAAA